MQINLNKVCQELSVEMYVFEPMGFLNYFQRLPQKDQELGIKETLVSLVKEVGNYGLGNQYFQSRLKENLKKNKLPQNIVIDQVDFFQVKTKVT